MTQPRQLTAEEIRDEFLQHLWMLIDYWAKEVRVENERDRLSGLVHSILTSIDGLSGGLTGSFHLIPSCHPEDPQYHKDNEENWWPSNSEVDLEKLSAITQSDILNDIFYRYDPQKRYGK